MTAQYSVIDHEVGKLIKYHRNLMGITQLELSRSVGFARDTIAHIETGRCTILVRNLFKFANVLNCSVRDLIPQALPLTNQSTGE